MLNVKVGRVNERNQDDPIYECKAASVKIDENGSLTISLLHGSKTFGKGTWNSLEVGPHA
jgi:hypothetical protein